MAKRRKHWTQTTRGKEKLSRIMREAHARKKNGSSSPKEEVHGVSTDESLHAAYVFGRFEGWLEVYASTNRVSYTALADAVAALLQGQAVRSVSRPHAPVSRVRRRPAA